MVFNCDCSAFTGGVFFFVQFGDGAVAGAADIADFQDGIAGVGKFELAGILFIRSDVSKVVNCCFRIIRLWVAWLQHQIALIVHSLPGRFLPGWLFLL